ncbi:MAG TPA: hydrogenase/urease maturation nickel metallochaperone HypA [Gemmatimonadales bacterium]|nr:hydrogenase/urease maturation nickel metallochaperone HypA [Gemmatimonadales bacterium]
MHEMSIALEVCRMAEERLGSPSAGDGGGGGPASLIAVGVEVGDDAGVEPENLSFCLEALLSSPPFQGARPVILRQPGDVLRLAYLEVDDGR